LFVKMQMVAKLFHFSCPTLHHLKIWKISDSFMNRYFPISTKIEPFIVPSTKIGRLMMKMNNGSLIANTNFALNWMDHCAYMVKIEPQNDATLLPDCANMPTYHS
jgi:hypothetical protein